MKGKEFYNFLIIATLIQFGVFANITELENLLETQLEIIEAIDKYLQSQAEIVQKISRMKEMYEKEYEIATTNEEKFLENPFNHYVLIKRLTTDYEDLRDLILNRTNGIEILNDLEEKDLDWPEEADLSDSEQAVLRLHQTYALDANEIAKGSLLDQNSSLPFNADDCAELGSWAFEDEEFELAAIWLQETLRQFAENEDEQSDISLKTIGPEVIQKYLYSIVVGDVDNKMEALTMAAEFMEVEGHRIYKELNKSAESRENDDINRNIFHRLCQGESLRSPSQDAKLHCHQQVREGHPYLRIQRIKEEELNLVPRVVLYHDILSDKEIDVIKSLAKHNLSEAAVANKDEDEHIDVSSRVAKVAWLAEEKHKVLASFSQRVEDITGLTTTGAEYLQVAMYGPGGHFKPHYDQEYDGASSENRTENPDERIATWLNYMSDVKAGGATIFPILGLSIKPEKGSAVFWHNLKKNGESYPGSLHGGCPVLVGSKWAANKWLHEFGQEFRRPCSLDPNE